MKVKLLLFVFFSKAGLKLNKKMVVSTYFVSSSPLFFNSFGYSAVSGALKAIRIMARNGRKKLAK